MLTAIFVNILIFGLNFSLLRANLTKIGWCHMILSQNQIVLRVPTAGGGWCLYRKTNMTLGIIVYRTNCFPPPPGGGYAPLQGLEMRRQLLLAS